MAPVDPNAEDELILVDEQDREIGYVAKAPCHRNPVPLHRAFSVFLFDPDGRMLITKRSDAKHTWPGHWTNACCSHPRRGEATEDAAERRLAEELGIHTPLSFLFTFTYEARYDATWGEHEVDHVFAGAFEGQVRPDPAEVAELKWIGPVDLRLEMARDPDAFTPWFTMAVERVLRAI